MTYLVNEVYYTIQGEGRRFGIPHVFVRFSACNLACGFCDTEFESGVPMEAETIVEACRVAAALQPPPPVPVVPGAKRRYPPALPPISPPCRNVLLCGGEPLLQVDAPLLEAFHAREDPWFVAVETNGTRPAPLAATVGPAGFDWVTVSPKVAEHALKIRHAHEVKYVRAAGQGLPVPSIKADHYSLSPMFDGDRPDPAALAHCAALVLANPLWQLTIQHHKAGFAGDREGGMR